MPEKIRWGILGPGGIAHSFAEGLKVLEDAEIVAVGSRSEKRAQEFASRYRIPGYYGSYEKLASDPDVDVVYIATPHAFHKENAVLCLQNNKAVLCEKAFTLNATDAKEVVSLARAKGLFLMEAMWTRFLPVIRRSLKFIEDGLIGKIRMMSADLGFNPPFDPQSRLFNPGLGGGALLDVGIYPLSLAYFILGKPDSYHSSAYLGKTGVDEQAVMAFSYNDGRMANLFTSIRAHLPSEAVIIGDKGRIRLHAPLYRPSGITLSVLGEKDEYIEPEMEGNGYNFEAAEVMQCIRKGMTESTVMPLDETIEIMKLMDDFRYSWGFRYPHEILKG